MSRLDARQRPSKLRNSGQCERYSRRPTRPRTSPTASSSAARAHRLSTATATLPTASLARCQLPQRGLESASSTTFRGSCKIFRIQPLPPPSQLPNWQPPMFLWHGRAANFLRPAAATCHDDDDDDDDSRVLRPSSQQSPASKLSGHGCYPSSSSLSMRVADRAIALLPPLNPH